MIFVFLVFCCCSAHAQRNYNLISADMVFELKNDTLFSNTGLKIFVGQKFILGEAAGANGYRSIISKKTAIVPSIWGQNKNYENAIENHVQPKKETAKLKVDLVPGIAMSVKKIYLDRTGKPHFYCIWLLSKKDNYRCDIKLALQLKELLLEQ